VGGGGRSPNLLQRLQARQRSLRLLSLGAAPGQQREHLQQRRQGGGNQPQLDSECTRPAPAPAVLIR
jgi:hypothetical protein